MTVNFTVKLEPFSFTDDPLDAAIHHGLPVWPGAICEALCPETVVPIAAPQFVAGYGLETPADWARVPLLHQMTRPRAWSDWFDRWGVAGAPAFRGQRFDQFGMIVEAAVAGLGAALVPRFLVEPELATGRLAAALDRPLSAGTGYWYVYPEEKSGSTLVRAFGDWLKVAAA